MTTLSRTLALLALLTAGGLGFYPSPVAGAEPRIVLRWSAVEEAERYELQIADDPEFAHLVLTEKVELNGYRWKAAPKITHYFRVRSIDAFGRKGEWSKPKQIEAVATHPPPPPRPEPPPIQTLPPPDLLRPAAGESVVWEAKRKPRIRLIWSERPGAAFQIEVAPDRDFRRGVARFKTSETQKSFRPARMGPFYWRVRCAAPRSEWGATGSFKVVPAAPVPGEPGEGARVLFSGNETEVALSWQAVFRATGYEVTLLDEAGEREPVVQRVEGESATVGGLGAGRYSWSVRALHRQAAVSEPSPSRAFALAREQQAEVAAVVEPAPPTAAASEPGPERNAESDRPPRDTSADQREDLPAFLYLAPRVGMVYNLGEVVAARIDGEIGGRLPVLERRLGLAISAGYYTVSTTGSDAGLSFESRLKVVPLEAVAVFSFPTSWLDLYLGAGLAVNLINVSVQVPTQPVLEETGVQLGALALLGAEWRLGPGRLFAQLSYQFASRAREGFGESDPGGLGAAVGYRIGLVR